MPLSISTALAEALIMIFTETQDMIRLLPPVVFVGADSVMPAIIHHKALVDKLL